MQQVREPDFTIDVCPSYGGRFLAKAELNALATGLSGDIEFCSVGCTTSETKRTNSLPEPARNALSRSWKKSTYLRFRI